MDALAVPWHHIDTTKTVLQNTGVSRESTELEAKIRTNQFGWDYDANLVGDSYYATITPRNLVITANADTIQQGAQDAPLTYSAMGLLQGDSLTGALARAVGNEAGSYAILLGTLDAGSNYSIVFTSANVIIVAPQKNSTPFALSWIPVIHVSTQGQAAQFALQNGSLASLPANTYVLLHVTGTGLDSSYVLDQQTVTWSPLAIGSYSLHYETHNADSILSNGNGDSTFVIRTLVKTPQQNKTWYMAGFGLDTVPFSQFKSTSQIFHWEDDHADGEYGRYASRNDLVRSQPGLGYWYFADDTSDTFQPTALSTTPAVNVSLLHANTGWNMIANPYPWTIALDTSLTYWTWGKGSYQPVQTLDALAAAWVNVNENQTLTLDPTPYFAPSDTAKSVLARRLVADFTSAQNWSVQIALHADGISDAWNFIGVGTQTNLLKPPAGFGQNASLTLVEQNQSLARSIKTSSQNASWTMELSSDQDRLGTLDFTGLSKLTQNGIQLSLLMADGSVQTLQGSSTVPVSLKKGTQQITIKATMGESTLALQGGLENLHVLNSGELVQLSFTASLAQAGSAAILDVVSPNGQVVLQQGLGTLQIGMNKVALPASNFNAGMYIFHIHTASSQVSTAWIKGF